MTWRLAPPQFILRSSRGIYTKLATMPRILPILGLALFLRCGALAQTSPPQPVLTLTLQDAFARARANGLQLLSADIAARIAREDRVQAKAALLPSVNWQNGFDYT